MPLRDARPTMADHSSPGVGSTRQPQHIQLQLQRSHYTIDVDLHLPSRGLTVLFGESGSGKTSLLRCIAGLERGSSAHIEIAGQCWQNDRKQIFIPTWKRPLGYVFQESSLFMHMSVQENLQYGLSRQTAKHQGICTWIKQLRRRKTSTLPAQLQPIVQMLGIEHLLQQRPQTLSGGERQRVAIARALATEPQVLLLDEPLSSLDATRRNEVLPWIENLRDELSIPIIYVTHSLLELERLADYVVIMRSGQAIASDSLENLCNTGVLSRHSEFALHTWVQGQIAELDQQWNRFAVRTAMGTLWLANASNRALMNHDKGQSIALLIPAHHIVLMPSRHLAHCHRHVENTFEATIYSIEIDSKNPGYQRVQLKIGDQSVTALVHNKQMHDQQLNLGTSVSAHIHKVTIR